MDVQAIYYGLGALSLIGGGIWRLSSKITALDTKVEILMTNHLPHLQDKLDRLEERLNG